jgi:HSP20 family protein
MKTMQLTRHCDPTGHVDFQAGVQLFQDAVNRLFSEPSSTRLWAPAVDILETENQLILRADLPDVDMKDIQIEVEGGTLTVKGERKFEKATESAVGYHRIERNYGQFMRCFSVPETVDADQVKASYKNGVLTVTLPKKEAAKPRTVKVEVTQ